MTEKQFQSTLPRGERPGAAAETFQLYTISIHAPARGATLTTFATRLYPCISIHAPARGATGCQIHGFYNILISIHAPARGATSDRSQTEKVGNISIHAPARGATRRAGKIGLPFSYFNPRSREGSDKGLLRDCIKDLLFQSTLPRGERLPEPQSLGRPCQFQSTLPRGERRK